jgi:hemolysin III
MKDDKRVTDTPEKHQSVKGYTVGEEVANSISHGIGAVLSIAGLALLVVFASRHGDVWHIVSFSIYGTSLVLLFLASTLYHSFSQPNIKRILRIIDHSSIYLLIGGTYTPFMLVSIRGAWGWSLFGVIWGLALIGIILKTMLAGKYRMVSTVTFVLMGWLCVIAFRQMLSGIPSQGMIWLAGGGIIYTLGTLFYAWRSLPYNHAIWHLFVLGGAACHFIAILVFVL